MTDKVRTHVDENGTATLLLNRPEVHNAFDPEMIDQLTGALEEIAASDDVRSVVLMGAGESFCAGADIAHMKASGSYTKKQNYAHAERSARMFHALYTLDKPTVACVRGAVRGGGCGLVAACDIAIASRLATFRFSEVKLGIIPAMISPYVIAAIGERMARRYMLTGEEMDSAEAYRIGLVHDIVEEEELLPRVSTILAQLYSSGPRAMAAVKTLISFTTHSAIDERLVAATSRRIADIRATPEAQEGLAAFLEKRKPSWVESNAAGAKRPARKATKKRAR
ncbi:MAG: enoyl-CoA hydratase-related protein [Rhodospirillaceae bacterium]